MQADKEATLGQADAGNEQSGPTGGGKGQEWSAPGHKPPLFSAVHRQALTRKPVIFRVDDATDELVAIFPTIPYGTDDDLACCYVIGVGWCGVSRARYACLRKPIGWEGQFLREALMAQGCTFLAARKNAAKRPTDVMESNRWSVREDERRKNARKAASGAQNCAAAGRRRVAGCSKTRGKHIPPVKSVFTVSAR